MATLVARSLALYTETMSEKRLPPIPPPSRQSPESDGETVIKERVKTQKPSLYKVLLHNDDYTTMEFVVHVLMRYFGKSENEANDVMLEVHHAGIGIAGVYTYEIAETKVLLVTEEAKRKQFPLKVTMEKSDG